MQYLGPREEPDLEVRHCFVIPDLEVKVPQILARCIWVRQASSRGIQVVSKRNNSARQHVQLKFASSVRILPLTS